MNKILKMINLSLFWYCTSPLFGFVQGVNAEIDTCILDEQSELELSVSVGENWRCEDGRLYRKLDLSSYSVLFPYCTSWGSSATLSGSFVTKIHRTSYPNYLSFDEMIETTIKFGLGGNYELYPLMIQGKQAKILLRQDSKEYIRISLFIDVSKESMVWLDGIPNCAFDEELEDVYSEIIEIQKSVQF